MSSASIKYSDDTDRAFGLCGMALALYIYAAEQYLAALSADAPADLGLELTPDFFTVANPALSAKNVWKSSLENFSLGSAMLLANLLARSLVRRHSELSQPVRNLAINVLGEEGCDACGLAEAEVTRMRDKAYMYMHRLLSHPGIAQIISDMAKTLQTERTLSRDRIMPYLSQISNY